MTDIQKLIAGARKGEFGPVHVLVGEETFLLDRAVSYLRKAAIADGIAGFNEDLFHGQGTKAEAIVSAANTLPMMASTRFVLVRGVDQMTPTEQDGLVGYVEKPSPSTCLVLTASKLDGRGKLPKAAKKAGVLVDVASLKGAALAGFAQQEARSRGHLLAPDATQALLDAIGDDLSALDDALERLSLFVGAGAPIDIPAIESCVTRIRTETIWALVDAVSARDARRAVPALASLLADQEPPLRILSMLARQIRMVAKMREALANGLKGAEAAAAAGAPPFKAGELTEAARRFSLPQLGRTFATLSRTDRLLKGSKVPADVLITEAVLDLCRAG